MLSPQKVIWDSQNAQITYLHRLLLDKNENSSHVDKLFRSRPNFNSMYILSHKYFWGIYFVIQWSRARSHVIFNGFGAVQFASVASVAPPDLFGPLEVYLLRLLLTTIHLSNSTRVHSWLRRCPHGVMFGIRLSLCRSFNTTFWRRDAIAAVSKHSLNVNWVVELQKIYS